MVTAVIHVKLTIYAVLIRATTGLALLVPAAGTQTLPIRRLITHATAKTGT